VVVTFTPASAAAFTASLQIGNSGSPNPAVSSLSGTGVGVSLSAFPPLTFASQAINSTSANQSVTVQNAGSVAAGLTTFTIIGANPGDFAISSQTCGTVLQSATACQVSVTFTPQATGYRSATLQITDTATNSPQTVTLSGTGIGAQLTVTPSLAFGTLTLGTNGVQAVDIENTGGLSVTLSSYTITGANPGDFSVSSTNCPSSLAVGYSCQVNIAFAPVATESRVANLQIGNNTSVNPISVSLGGTGSVTLPLQISQVSGLATTLAQKPNMGTSYSPSAAAWIDASGNIGAVTGNPTNCVYVNGTSGACGSGGGNTVSVAFIDAATPSGLVNGINNTFTLAQAPNPASSLEIFLNGVLQEAPSDYTLSGSTLTFTDIPMADDVLVAYYRVNGPSQTVSFSDAETPGGLINGVNTTYSLANTPIGGLRVYKNGVLLTNGADYTVAGATLTFTNIAIPNPGDTLLAYYRY
jgi:hypothetical protein